MPNTGLRRLAAFIAFAMVLTASWQSMGPSPAPPALASALGNGE